MTARHRSRLTGTAVAVVLAACGAGGNGVSGAQAAEGEVLVSAAASLTDALADIEVAFEDAYEEVDVVLNLGASSALREQILEGAPADVYASADVSNMDRVVDAGEAEGWEVFARNLLQIAVPAGNPARIQGLEDLADEQLLVGLCAAGVPCGDFARQALANAGVDASVDTDEPDVRALLTKIELGELDAGIVYITDVRAAGGAVDGVDIPREVNVVADYQIAVLANASNPRGAAALVEFALSARGQAILADHGFATP